MNGPPPGTGGPRPDPLANPYPGLRAFDPGEVDLFFGRETQVDELLSRLQTTRFLAVLGPSGGGKSSLVRAGLLPALHGGFMARAGSSWRTAVFRPEDDPIGNLARALSAPGVLGSGADGEMAEMEALIAETTLRGGMTGLADAVRQARLPTGDNVLLVVDQFEELFRYARGGDDDLSDDPTLFAQLLIRATRERHASMYVVLTMRSDFLGDCTRIAGLAEAINDGVYLIPQFTREERQRAIEGPVGVRGRRMTRGLVLRLLNDLGDRQDRLPILQHAMMRTWDEWRRAGRPDEPLDLDHYEAIGGMEAALSRHADGAYRDLATDRQREIARAMFKRLTYRENEGRGVRRPSTVAEIARVVEATPEEVVAVAEPFRHRAQSFLLPPLDPAAGTERAVTAATVFDISHESLMRVWNDLDAWVAEETTNRQRYVELADAAAQHQRGEKAYLVEPELDIFLSWWRKTRPTEAWAAQYDPSFQRARLYLEGSAEKRDREALRAEERRKRTLRMLWGWSVASAVAIVVFIALGVITVTAQNTARAALSRADSAQAAADTAQSLADAARGRARADSLAAVRARARADTAQRTADTALARAATAAAAARVAQSRADSLRTEAEAAQGEARDAATAAARADTAARAAQARADRATDEIESLNRAAAARRLALESSRQTPRLQRLMALHAFNLQAASDRPLLDRDVYRALATSLDDSVRVVPAAHRDQVRAAALAPDDTWTASVDNAGVLCRTALGDPPGAHSWCWGDVGQPLRAVAVGPAGRDLVAAGAQDGRVYLWDAADPEARPRDLGSPACPLSSDGCSAPVRALRFYAGESEAELWAIGADGSLRGWVLPPRPAQAGALDPVDLGDGASVVAAALAPDAPWLVLARSDGSYASLPVGSHADGGVGGTAPPGAAVSAAALAGDGRGAFAVGLSDGRIVCHGCGGASRRAELTGHAAGVTGLAFLGDGGLLVSSSLDRTARIWTPGRGEAASIPLTEHTGWVWSVAGGSDGDLFVTAGADQTVRVWHADARALAVEVFRRSCAEGDAELAREEWEQLTMGIPFEPPLATFADRHGGEPCAR